MQGRRSEAGGRLWCLIALAGLMLAFDLPAWSQQAVFPAGAKVVARPSSQWEACTVVQPMPESRAYKVACRTGEYIVATSSVQAPTPEALALTLPPSAAPGMPQVGDRVLASPMGLDNDWRSCVVTRDLTYQGAYQVRCGTADWTVVMKWVKKAPGQAGPLPSPEAAPAPARSPAPAPSAAPPAPPPPPAANVPAALPAVTPAEGRNGVIPDGVYVAPVGGSLETLQIIGGRMAQGPRVHLTARTMTTAHARQVGTVQVAGDSLTVTWTDGKVRTGAFKLSGRCLSWGYLYCRASPFDRGARLEGRYAGSATAGGGVVSRSFEIVFESDGTYRSTATGAIGAPAGTTGAAAATGASRGRFQIAGWTLRLMPESGGTLEYLAFPYDVYGKADRLYFDGGFLSKRE